MSLLSWTTMGLLLAGGGLFARRPEPGRGVRRRPQRVLNPQRLAGVRADAVWMLAGDPHCAQGHRLNGRRFQTSDAPDLAGSCGIHCHCHYHAVPDRRGRDRRSEGSERRDSLRFSLADGRRAQHRRTQTGPWINPLRRF